MYQFLVICFHYVSFISDRITTFRSSVAFSDADIIFARESPKRQYMKKQLMVALKQHGDGLKNLEEKTLLCGDQMLKIMEEHKGDGFEPGSLIHKTVAQIMLILIFGQCSKEDAAAFIEAQDSLEEVLRPDGAYLILDILPSLKYVLPTVKRAYTALINEVTRANSIYDNKIAARRKLYDHPNVEVFIDHFLKLKIMNQAGDTTKTIDENDIRSMGIDMFGAGMSTTAKTLEMMLAILVNHPEIQDAVHKEICDVIGTRKPKMEDKLLMPFTEAVILETLRYHSLVPFPIPRVPRYDSMLQGYLIPAGTMVFVNLWALHHDDRYWKSPWQFNPNRWLENGKIVPPDHIKKQRLLPFGAGKRQCPGEVFAKNRLFLLATMMLQKFKFVPAEGHPKPNHDPSKCKIKIILMQDPYKLCVKPRH